LEVALAVVAEEETVSAEVSIHNYDPEGPADMVGFACLSAASRKVQHFDH
jgi:hypothetical protein